MTTTRMDKALTTFGVIVFIALVVVVIVALTAIFIALELMP